MFRIAGPRMATPWLVCRRAERILQTIHIPTIQPQGMRRWAQTAAILAINNLCILKSMHLPVVYMFAGSMLRESCSSACLAIISAKRTPRHPTRIQYNRRRSKYCLGMILVARSGLGSTLACLTSQQCKLETEGGCLIRREIEHIVTLTLITPHRL